MKKIAFFALCFLSSISIQHISAMGQGPKVKPQSPASLWLKLRKVKGNPKELARIVRDADPDLLGETLILAAESKEAPMVIALLNGGADPNYISEQDKYTPLSRSCSSFCKNGGDDCISPLIEAKADVNLHLIFPVDHVLQRAIESRNLAAVRMLVPAGVDTSSARKWARKSRKKWRAIVDEYPSNAKDEVAENELVEAEEIVTYLKNRARHDRAAAQAASRAKLVGGQENKEEDPPAYEDIAKQHGNNCQAFLQDGAAHEENAQEQEDAPPRYENIAGQHGNNGQAVPARWWHRWRSRRSIAKTNPF